MNTRFRNLGCVEKVVIVQGTFCAIFVVSQPGFYPQIQNDWLQDSHVSYGESTPQPLFWCSFQALFLSLPFSPCLHLFRYLCFPLYNICFECSLLSLRHYGLRYRRSHAAYLFTLLLMGEIPRFGKTHPATSLLLEGEQTTLRICIWHTTARARVFREIGLTGLREDASSQVPTSWQESDE